MSFLSFISLSYFKIKFKIRKNKKKGRSAPQQPGAQGGAGAAPEGEAEPALTAGPALPLRPSPPAALAPPAGPAAPGTRMSRHHPPRPRQAAGLPCLTSGVHSPSGPGHQSRAPAPAHGRSGSYLRAGKSRVWRRNGSGAALGRLLYKELLAKAERECSTFTKGKKESLQSWEAANRARERSGGELALGKVVGTMLPRRIPQEPGMDQPLRPDPALGTNKSVEQRRGKD